MRVRMLRSLVPGARWRWLASALWLGLTAGAPASAVEIAASADGAAARPPVEISVLTYNTHGLPAWIAGDDPAARYPKILAKAEAYDVVLLQEDFAHQPVVDAHARHQRIVRGNGPRRAWPLHHGSGLTLLTHFEAAAQAVSATYGICHGWLGAANDCFAEKGFLAKRLALPNGAELDVWNTHLDAGDADGDHAARVAQLERLAREIGAKSAGRPLVVGGDFNLRWDDPRDRALLDGWLESLGLALAAVAPAGTWASRIDYLFYRGAPGTDLEVLGGGKTCEFIGPRGEPLSDHPAVFARFRVR